jgi:hypothetical protein
LLSVFLYGCKAFAAVNRTSVLRFKRYFGFTAAFGANGLVHFALRVAAAFVVLAALFAALRLVLEAFLSIEFLLACGEYKFLPAVRANERFVFKHGLY